MYIFFSHWDLQKINFLCDNFQLLFIWHAKYKPNICAKKLFSNTFFKSKWNSTWLQKKKEMGQGEIESINIYIVNCTIKYLYFLDDHWWDHSGKRMIYSSRWPFGCVINFPLEKSIKNMEMTSAIPYVLMITASFVASWSIKVFEFFVTLSVLNYLPILLYFSILLFLVE